MSVLLLCGTARGETELEAGERLYQQGRDEEARFEFAAALADYDASLTRAPSGRWALAARARADDLHAHAEGAFAPLTALERSRRGTQTNEALDALVKDAEGFPNGPVRSEARMLAAESFLSALHRPEDGKRMLGLVLDDSSADPTLRHFAARRIADLALKDGRMADAKKAALAAGDPWLEKKVTHTIRRAIARKLSLGAIGCALVLALGAIVWRRKRLEARALVSRLKIIALFSAVAASGGALASSYEKGHALPFLALGLSIGVIASLALAWSSIGSNALWARAGRSLVCAAAVIGAGFLALDRIDASYLEAFGL